MLKPAHVPTPLVPDAERPPLVIAPTPTPPRFPTLAVFARVGRWLLVVLTLRLTGRGTPAAYGRHLRLLLEDFGGLWVKLGQLLSLRVDLFPLAFARELAQLQIKAIGFPPEDAAAILVAELGQPIERVFSEFERVPFAAASMGQVHRGRLGENGVRVAVKIQRPQLPELFGHQLKVIRLLLGTLERFGINPHMRYGDLIWELEEMMREELDCRYEAAAARRMRRALHDHGVFVPKVFLATRRVLASEFVDGVLMADYIHEGGGNPARLQAWTAENAVDPEAIGRTLILSLLRQMLEDDSYHGDLHPGNVMLLRDSRVALLDFGACNFTERSYLDRFRQMLRALASRDYRAAADLTLQLCGSLPPIDLEAMREEFELAMAAWARRTEVPELPYHDKSVAALYNDVSRIMYEHGCTVEWSLLRLRRALETLDASLMHLFQRADYPALVEDYFRAAARRERERGSLVSAAAGALSGLRAATEALSHVEEYSVFQGAIIRRHARRFQYVTTRAVHLLTRTVRQLRVLGVLALVAGAFMLVAQHRPEWLRGFAPILVSRLAAVAPRLDWQVWILLLAVTAWSLVTIGRLCARLDVGDGQAADRVATV